MRCNATCNLHVIFLQNNPTQDWFKFSIDGRTPIMLAAPDANVNQDARTFTCDGCGSATAGVAAVGGAVRGPVAPTAGAQPAKRR